MEENFDEIEKQMRRGKKSSTQSYADFNNVKAKVMSWLMRNGNIKKLIFSLAIVVVFGLSAIITCLIYNTFYITYISSVVFSLFIIRFLIKRINKKFK